MAGKKYREAASQVDQSRVYSIDEAVELTKKVAFAKFDETVEVGMTLGVDPRKADQLVRGTVVLPHCAVKAAPAGNDHVPTNASEGPA